VCQNREQDQARVTEWSDGDKRTYKTVTTIEEWIWTFTVEYKLVGYCGADPDKRVVLQGRTGSVEIITTTDKSPRPEIRVVDPIEVNITWLLRETFKIDRNAKSCRTPRRNNDVEAALNAFESLHSWCARVASYFQSSGFSAQALDKLDMGAINANGVFVPFVLLMLPPTGEQKTGALLPAKDQQAFIDEQNRILEAKLTSRASCRSRCTRSSSSGGDAAAGEPHAKRARSSNAVVVSTPTSVKSFMLKFIELQTALCEMSDEGRQELARSAATPLLGSLMRLIKRAPAEKRNDAIKQGLVRRAARFWRCSAGSCTRSSRS
jgi:hypothetical protein